MVMISSPDKPTLSAAIITFNEESNINDCLSSLETLVDEIIVLDSFSTDATKEMCKENAKVSFHEHAFDGHIEQKNRALALCNGDWILSLDADERVSPELHQAVLSYINSNPDSNGAKFPRRTSHSGEFIWHGGWYPNARFRLIRKGKGRWGGDNPHDYLIVDGATSTLSGDLIHHTCKDLSEHVETVNQFSSIVALTRFHAGKRYRLWRLLLLPIWKFFELYCIKRGFLDRTRGFTIAVTSAYSTFLKEAKLYELDVLQLGKPGNLGSRYEKQDI